jgi:Site-specific recombinase XerD
MAETYTKQRSKDLTLKTRALLREMPNVCAGFVSHIAATTQPLTRYAYVSDIKTFCTYLTEEVPLFASKKICELKPADFEDVTVPMLHAYLEYLSYYIKDDSEHSNADAAKQRKLSSLRRFYEYMFKSELIASDVSRLVEMPKRREKPILRLEIDEMARLLDSVESGQLQNTHQRKYNDNTRLRDLTIVTLFLGTGIRVSELVGLDIEDIDFSINGFLVTRKGGYQAILYFPDEVADVLRRYMEFRKDQEACPGNENALFCPCKTKESLYGLCR